MIGLPCLAVVGAAWAFTASLWGSAVLLLMLTSLLVQLAGAMYLAGIQVNAGARVGGGDAVDGVVHVISSVLPPLPPAQLIHPTPQTHTDKH